MTAKLGVRARRRQQVNEHLSAALTNEQVTRERVDALEAWATHTGELVCDRYEDLESWRDLRDRGVLGRLRWLVLGR